mgnify:CR=1 FL=1
MNIFSKQFLSLFVFFLSFGVLKPFASYEVLICDCPEVLIVQSAHEKIREDFITELKLRELFLKIEKDLYKQRIFWDSFFKHLQNNLKKINAEDEEKNFVSQEEDKNSVFIEDQNPVSEAEARELFAILGGFSEDDLRRKYKELMLKWHPDKNPNNITFAKEMTQKIINAYERLKEICKSEK